jgi:hypothetical protein
MLMPRGVKERNGAIDNHPRQKEFKGSFGKEM